MAKEKKNERLLKLNMTFEKAMKKALNTPLPKKKRKKSTQILHLNTVIGLFAFKSKHSTVGVPKSTLY